MTPPLHHVLARRAVIALVGIAAVAFFFRFHIAGGFARFSGDSYDGMIEVSILQHWANVFAGAEPWNRLAYFQPAADSLGYNDGYLLYGVIYAVARAAGLPLVAAAECVNVGMKLIGFAGMYALLRRRGECRTGWALFGATLFTIADITLIHVNHAQLLTVALAPIAGLWAWDAVAALYAGDARALVVKGVAFVTLFAAWISTAYYPAWFFAFFLLVAAAVHLAPRSARQEVWRVAKPMARSLALVAGWALLMLAPFLAVYIAKAVETGSRGFSGVSRTTITPVEFFNPGATNWLWSAPYRLLSAPFGFASAGKQDAMFGVAPVLLILCLVVVVRAFRASAPAVGWRLVAMALGTCWLLMMRIGPVTPWYAVHLIVPGASALRVIGRFQIVLLVPAIALAVRAVQDMRARWAAVVAVTLVAEQAAATGAPVRLDQAAQLAMIRDMPPPAAGCRYFVVRSGRPYPYPVQDPANDAAYAHNVDAMVLAEVHRLPMLNGFSSFNPPGWDFADPAQADFPQRVQAYARRFGLTDLCMLDRQHADRWMPLAP